MRSKIFFLRQSFFDPRLLPTYCPIFQFLFTAKHLHLIVCGYCLHLHFLFSHTCSPFQRDYFIKVTHQLHFAESNALFFCDLSATFRADHTSVKHILFLTFEISYFLVFLLSCWLLLPNVPSCSC